MRRRLIYSWIDDSRFTRSSRPGVAIDGKVLTEGHRAGSILMISNCGPDESLVPFASAIGAECAIIALRANAEDLVIDTESSAVVCNRRS